MRSGKDTKGKREEGRRRKHPIQAADCERVETYDECEGELAYVHTDRRYSQQSAPATITTFTCLTSRW
jgi:hypothetical protein